MSYFGSDASSSHTTTRKSAGAPQDGARPKETDPDQNKLKINETANTLLQTA